MIVNIFKYVTGHVRSILNKRFHKPSPLWSIQTELDRDRDRDRDNWVHRILWVQFTLQLELDRDRDWELNEWVSNPFFVTYPVTLQDVVTGKFPFSCFIYQFLHIMLNPVVCKYGAKCSKSAK